MAHDAKRGKMFKWLLDTAHNKRKYAKAVYNGINDIYTIYGRLYATNGILLAEIQYPEFEHLSDDGWMVVDEIVGDDGYYLETPRVHQSLRNWDDRYLSKMFLRPDEIQTPVEFLFDASVMKDALKPFEIYGINPCLTIAAYKAELTGHDKEVSIKIMFMGVRK